MVQNPDGGWGESCESYDDADKKGAGPSTCSQTAWALLGLMAAGDYRSDCLARGVAYLLKQQKADGSWFEAPYTGTGFPRVFYLKYHMYAQYFPLLALTKYAKVVASQERQANTGDAAFAGLAGDTIRGD
jgi:squalene-hopene/tetraprenyl-beta-curcumene cyclase